MLTKIKQTAFFSVLSVLLGLPFTASAMVFNPSENLDVHLGGSATFEYDSFALNEGLTLNYFAPENSVIEIVSQGDIFIGGDIFSSLNGTTLSFKTSANIAISGHLSASTLSISGHEIQLLAGGVIKVADDGEGVVLLNAYNSGALLTSGASGAIKIAQDVKVKSGGVLINGNKPIKGGTIELTPLGGEGRLEIQLSTPVPLPAPVLLFSSALLCLAGFRKKAN